VGKKAEGAKNFVSKIAIQADNHPFLDISLFLDTNRCT
jgi:hypothetical protein